MKTTKLNTSIRDQVTYYLDKIFIKDKINADYNEELKAILQLFLASDFDWDELEIMDYFDMEMHILHFILKSATEVEEYELCAKVFKFIKLEYKLFQEFINSLPEASQISLKVNTFVFIIF